MDRFRGTVDGALAEQHESSGTPILVEPGWLQEHLDDARVRVVHVDVAAASYGQAHIPGAVLWNIYADLRRPDYQLVDSAAIESLVQTSGIDADSTVIFTGYAPALGLWLLQAHGHPHVAVLNCSLSSWQAQGGPVTSHVTSPGASNYRLPGVNLALRARGDDVERAIGDSSTSILDVRSVAEYRGDRFWPSGGQQAGGRTGHVPTAVHVPIDGILDDLGTFRNPGALAGALTAADLGPGGLITYCTIGARAATAWFVLTYLLGRGNVRVYDGSWAEWGLDPARPVERT